MKKTFELTHPKIKYPRMIEAVKHEVRKYLKRERNKKLPEDADFWGFNCRFGHLEAEATDIHVKDIDKCINEAESKELPSFYLEILAYPAVRAPRPENIDLDSDSSEAE